MWRVVGCRWGFDGDDAFDGDGDGDDDAFWGVTLSDFESDWLCLCLCL